MAEGTALATAPPSDPAARPPSAEGTILGLMLGPAVEAAEAVVETAKRAGRRPVLVAASYEFHRHETIAGVTVRAPMDYLSAREADAVHDETYRWQQGLMAGRLADGRTLEAASSPPGYDPAAPAWILRFVAHVHVRLRFVKFVRALLAEETPATLVLVGRSETQAWAVELLAEILRTDAADAEIVPAEAYVARDLAWRMTLVAEERELERQRALRSANARALKTALSALRAAKGDPADGDDPVLDVLLERIDQALFAPDAEVADRLARSHQALESRLEMVQSRYTEANERARALEREARRAEREANRLTSANARLATMRRNLQQALGQRTRSARPGGRLASLVYALTGRAPSDSVTQKRIKRLELSLKAQQQRADVLAKRVSTVASKNTKLKRKLDALEAERGDGGRRVGLLGFFTLRRRRTDADEPPADTRVGGVGDADG